MQKNRKIFSVLAQGNSMYPILHDGDTVQYIQVAFREVKLNDILLVYENGILVTHRVIYKTKIICITRGDNNMKADIITQKERVIAKVTRFKRGGIWHGLQDAYFIQSSLYLAEIHKLEIILQLKKIPHVFLKGVLVSLRYEGAIPQRIYADCDILVQRGNVHTIASAMKKLGYRLVEKSLLNQHKVNPQKNPEVSYFKMTQGISVVFDVHFEPVFLMTQLEGMHLLYSKKLLIDLGRLIITRGEVKKIKGFHYSLCAISDQILYLALHIFHHNFTDSVRYQLLDAVVRKSASKKIWEELQKTVLSYKLEGYLYGVFILLKKYFHTPIPLSFLSAIRPRGYRYSVIRYQLNHVDIFSQEARLKAGVERFILIILLSPEPLWKKILIFIHPKALLLASIFICKLLYIKK